MVGKTEKRGVAKAFTIVELLIVIVVIGILAAIVIVGYGAVINSANDKSVQSDLVKIDTVFKQYSLDTNGSYPNTLQALSSLHLQLNGKSYMTTNQANIYVCNNPNNTEYAVVAMSKSGKRFMIKSEKGISDFTANVVWDANNSNWAATCSAVDPTYAPLTGNVTGMIGSAWLGWTGVVDSSQYITNVINNPSLESGNTTSLDSYYGAPIVVDSSKAAFGTYSVKITTNSTTYPQGVIFYGANIAGPNLTYTCSISLTGTPGKVMNVGGRVLDASGGYISEGNGAVNMTLSSLWQRISVTFTTPAGTGMVGVQARLLSPDATTTIWADGAMCAQTATSFSYADGTTAGWQWNGTINSSTSSGVGL